MFRGPLTGRIKPDTQESGNQQSRELMKVPGRRPEAEPKVAKVVCVLFQPERWSQPRRDSPRIGKPSVEALRQCLLVLFCFGSLGIFYSCYSVT